MGFELRSERYENAHSPLKWLHNECQSAVEATWANISAGKGCRRCGRERTKQAAIERGRRFFDKFLSVVEQRGGKCLEKAYAGSDKRYPVQCAARHAPFQANPHAVVDKGVWCPECRHLVGEARCRVFFEDKFGKPFPKSRPLWLCTREGARMELDGYNADLGIAFEHHGEQHYSLKGRGIKTADKLDTRKLLDRHKNRLCREHGVALVVIPELGSRTRVSELQDLVKAQLNGLDRPLPADFDTRVVEWDRA